MILTCPILCWLRKLHLRYWIVHFFTFLPCNHMLSGVQFQRRVLESTSEKAFQQMDAAWCLFTIMLHLSFVKPCSAKVCTNCCDLFISVIEFGFIPLKSSLHSHSSRNRLSILFSCKIILTHFSLEVSQYTDVSHYIIDLILWLHSINYV